MGKENLFDFTSENRESLRQLINSIPVPIFYKNTDGIYVECNEAFEKFLDLPREKIVGKTVFDVAPRDKAEKYLAQDKELLENPGTQVYRYQVVSSSGTEYDVQFNKSTFLSKDNEVLGMIGVINIISHRKQPKQA